MAKTTFRSVDDYLAAQPKAARAKTASAVKNTTAVKNTAAEKKKKTKQVEK